MKCLLRDVEPILINKRQAHDIMKNIQVSGRIDLIVLKDKDY